MDPLKLLKNNYENKAVFETLLSSRMTPSATAREASNTKHASSGYSNLSDTEAPKIPTFQGSKNSDTVFG